MPEDYLEVKNLDKYQHYKDRHLIWIKWYIKDIDKIFDSLPAASKWLYVGIIGIACRCDNKVTRDVEWLHKELAYKEKTGDFKKYLNILIDSKLIEVRYQSAEPIRDHDMRKGYTDRIYKHDMKKGYKDRIYKQDIKKEEEDISIIIPLELKDLKLYESDKKLLSRWQEIFPIWQTAYPGVNIRAEICRAHAWEIANPSRRKIDKTRFLGAWLARCQDKPQGNYIDRKNEPEIKCEFCGQNAPRLIDYRHVLRPDYLEIIKAKKYRLWQVKNICPKCLDNLSYFLKTFKGDIGQGIRLERSEGTVDEVLKSIPPKKGEK